MEMLFYTLHKDNFFLLLRLLFFNFLIPARSFVTDKGIHFQFKTVDFLLYNPPQKLTQKYVYTRNIGS